MRHYMLAYLFKDTCISVFRKTRQRHQRGFYAETPRRKSTSSLELVASGTSWERADREPAAATSTWSREIPAFAAKKQTPQRGIRDGLCFVCTPKSPPMIQRQLFFVHAKESSAFYLKDGERLSS